MSTGLSRVDFAKSLGVPVSAYANYEWGNAKVPARVGWNVCHQFGINQEWLATGKEPRRPAYQLHTLMVPDEAFDEPFSAVFERYLCEEIVKRRAEELRATGEISSTGGMEAPIKPGVGSEMALPYLIDLLNASAQRLPIHLHWKLFDEVVAAIRRLDDRYAAEIRQYEAAKEAATGLAAVTRWRVKSGVEIRVAETQFDKTQFFGDTSDVRLTWNDLRKRLVKATDGSGKKSEAAKFVGVNQSNLTRWINDEREPGAQAAFRILEWVTAEEAKTKSPGTGATESGQMTPKGKDNEQVQSSEPREVSPGRSSKSTPQRRKSTTGK